MKKTILYVVFSIVLLQILPLKSYSQSAREFYNVAIVEFNNGNYKSSLNNLDKVINKIGSTNARIQYYKSKCYYELQDYYQCKQEIMNYRKTNRDNAAWDQEMNALYSKANDEINKQKQLVAAKEYKKKQEVERRKREEYENSPERNPNRWIMKAVKENNIDFLNELISYGADINKELITNPNEYYGKCTPLQYCLFPEYKFCKDRIYKNYDYKKNSKEIIEKLLILGANPNKWSNDYDPWEFRSKIGLLSDYRTNYCRYPVYYPYDCYQIPKSCLSAAIYCSELGDDYLYILQLIADYGGQIKFYDSSHEGYAIDVLFYELTIRRNYTDEQLIRLFDTLISNGLDPTLCLSSIAKFHQFGRPKDKLSKYSLKYYNFLERDLYFLAEFLLENGAKIKYNCEGKGKCGPLYLAKLYNRKDIIKLMKQYQ